MQIGRRLLNKMSKSVLAILPGGAEEMELVITVDVLRRGGVSINNLQISFWFENYQENS